MSEGCNHDCDSCSQNCRERKPQSPRAELNPKSSVKKVVAVVSGKGGVGKSLVTGLLACRSRKQGLRTAILDADITGPSIPKMFGVENHASGDESGLIFPEQTDSGIEIMSINLILNNNTDPVIWRGPMIAGVVKQFWSNVLWENIDVMYVDMPPGTGDVPLTVFQSLPVDGVVVVATPQDLVSMIVSKAVKMAEMMEVPVLGLVENMSCITCPDCGKQIPVFGKSNAEALAEEFGIPLLARIPIDPQLAALCDSGSIEHFEGDLFDGTTLP